MSRESSKAFWIFCVIAVGLMVAIAGVGYIYNETDGQYAGAARLMAEGGSWIIPENNGIPRLVKPPFLYWAIAVSMKIFGNNEFAARLPNALAIAALAMIAWLFGRSGGSQRTALLSAFILLTSLGAFTLGRIIMPEPLFSLMIAAALACVLMSFKKAEYLKCWGVGFWFCVALASFAKGWHGFVYPITIVGCAAVVSPALRPFLRSLLWWPGPLLFLLINIPWYFVVEAKFPGFIQNLFFDEWYGHLAGTGDMELGYTNVPRWQFLLLQGVWFLPWTLVALPGSFRIPLHQWVAGLRTCPIKSILFFWIAIVLGSVLLMGQRQDYYAMAMWPAAAVVLASILDEYALKIGSALAGGIFVTLAIIIFFFSMPADGQTVALVERSTAWNTFFGLGCEVWKDLKNGGILVMIISGISFCMSAMFMHVQRWGCAMGALACAATIIGMGAVWGTAKIAPYFSLASIIPYVEKNASEEVVLAFEGGLDTASSLLFYSKRKLLLVGADPMANFVVRTKGTGRDSFLTEEEVVALWCAGYPLALIIESQRVDYWQKLLKSRVPAFAKSGTQVLLRNY